MDHVRDTSSITEGRADKLAKHNLFETPRFFADVYVLRPGQAQKVHRHAGEDKCYHVLDGTVRVRTGADVVTATTGHIVFCPAGEEHGVENASGADARLLVFMAPHPAPASAEPTEPASRA